MNNGLSNDVEHNVVHLQTTRGHVEDDVSHIYTATDTDDDDGAVLAAEEELRLRRPWRSSVSW